MLRSNQQYKYLCKKSKENVVPIGISHSIIFVCDICNLLHRLTLIVTQIFRLNIVPSISNTANTLFPNISRLEMTNLILASGPSSYRLAKNQLAGKRNACLPFSSASPCEVQPTNDDTMERSSLICASNLPVPSNLRRQRHAHGRKVPLTNKINESLCRGSATFRAAAAGLQMSGKW